MEIKKMPKNANIFHCEKCNFKCSKKSNYEAHLLTAKHINRTNRTEKKPNNANQFKCECGKIYKARNSLWYHKQKCTYIEDNKNKKIVEEKKEENNDNEPSYKELLLQAMKQLQEKDEKMMKALEKKDEQINKMMPLIGNNNNNTTNNTNFNLNFFLNETCKDALNITDFIDSLKLQLEDFEYTAENGHIKGITNIFQTALSNIEENKRPMHCTDLKREVLYIKDNDEWNKDNNNEKIKETIGEITNKNICNTGRWLEKYPDHTDPNSKDFEKYMKMTSNCMGSGEETDNNKIARNIMKEVIINK
jgi:hypothetical protein